MKQELKDLYEQKIQNILNNKPIRCNKPTPLAGKTLSQNQIGALKNYDNYLKVKGKELRTRCNCLGALRLFFLLAKKADPKNVKEQDVINFLQKYENYQTKKFYWVCLNGFFKRIGKEEIISHLRPQTKKKQNVIKDVLNPKEVAKMISYADDFRTKALISLMMDAGLRIGEVIALKVKNLIQDDYGMKVIMQEGKTGERQVRLTDSIPDIRNHLNSFKFKIETKEGLKPDPEAYLFNSLAGYKPENRNKEDTNSREKTLNKKIRKKRGISYEGIYGILKKVGERAGITKNVHPHIFRHSRAHQLLMEGWSVHEVQKHLGHSSITSTEVYLNYSSEDYHNAVLKRKGLIKNKHKKAAQDKSLEPRRCFHCSHENPGHVQFCERCNGPITLKAIERVKARHTVRSVAKYEGVPDDDRQALVMLIDKLFEKGIINPKDFGGKIQC